MKENIIFEKCLKFSVRMVKFAEFLESKKQRVIANQILRSGTSIGANVAESKYASSTLDFINKLKIAEKEASETVYWLQVLKEASCIDESQFESLYADAYELLKMIASSIITSKKSSIVNRKS